MSISVESLIKTIKSEICQRIWKSDHKQYLKRKSLELKIYTGYKESIKSLSPVLY